MKVGLTISGHQQLLLAAVDAAPAVPQRASGSENVLHFLDLHPVMLHIQSYLDFGERAQLTLVCKSVLHQVELYSRVAFQKIKQEHGVDRRFDKRVCDQATTTDRDSWRYKLWAAIHLHYLYKINIRKIKGIQGCKFGCEPPLLSPSGNRLAVRGYLHFPADLTATERSMWRQCKYSIFRPRSALTS